MNIDELKKGILADIVRIEYSIHGFRRMLEKGISRSDVRECILNGEIIEDYPLNDDALSEASLPACLVLGFRSIDNKSLPITRTRPIGSRIIKQGGEYHVQKVSG